MKVEKVPLAEAVGHILVHNQAGPDGRKILKKGQRLAAENLATLQGLGQTEVYIAILSEEDVDENEAARRLGRIIVGEGLTTSSATTGRVNLITQVNGLFKVNVKALLEFNDRLDITLATIPNNSLVQPKTIVGTIKIIPYSVPKADLEAAEAVARRQPLVEVKPFVVQQAALI